MNEKGVWWPLCSDSGLVVGCWMAVNEKGVWWPLCSDSGFVVGCWMAMNEKGVWWAPLFRQWVYSWLLDGSE